MEISSPQHYLMEFVIIIIVQFNLRIKGISFTVKFHFQDGGIFIKTVQQCRSHWLAFHLITGYLNPGEGKDLRHVLTCWWRGFLQNKAK